MSEPYYSGFGCRLFSGLLGLVLLGAVGYWVVDSGVNDAGSVALALGLLALGLDLLVAAVRGRESWLARLGPLP